MLNYGLLGPQAHIEEISLEEDSISTYEKIVSVALGMNHNRESSY